MDFTIKAADGGEFSAYIAVPEGISAENQAPAVIVIQEIFGINDELRTKADDLAKQGYLAICPDLFWRIEPGIDLADSIPEQLEHAFQLFGEFDVNQGLSDLKATLEAVRNDPRCNGTVGCVGYCLGGKLAYLMACESDIDASVGYYGVQIETMLDKAAHITKPLMLHIAEEDEFVAPEAQEEIKSALSTNPLISIHSYADVSHAFARGNGMHYNDAAATQANTRTATFFKEMLENK